MTYDSIEKLEVGEGTVLEQPAGAMQLPINTLQQLWTEFGVMAVRGLMDVTTEGLRNDEFPEIKPMGVRDVVEAAWGRKEG